MIDWALTKEKLGIVNLIGYKSRAFVRCDKCNKELNIEIRDKSKIKNGQMPWLCHSCKGKEVGWKLMESTLKSWQNEGYKKKIKTCSLDMCQCAEYRKIQNESVNTEESKKKCSDAAIKAWAEEKYKLQHAAARVKQLYTKPKTEVKFEQILKDMKIEFKIKFKLGFIHSISE